MEQTGTQARHMIENRKPRQGQGLVEFALLLPILVLVVFGVLELGRAFFAFIAITNAAREGARVYTFRPDVTTLANIYTAIDSEVSASPLVKSTSIASREVRCGNSYAAASNDTALRACPKGQPIRVTVTYNHTLILRLVFPQTLTLRRSAEMMVP
jgi:Flp pilus assembly protein TadG